MAVAIGADVTVDGIPVQAAPEGGVIFHRGAGAALEIAHPPTLHPVLPLGSDQEGLELLLADAALARRLADPRHPLAERWQGTRRVRLGTVELADLEPGSWRPLSSRERARLRLGAHLPPNAR